MHVEPVLLLRRILQHTPIRQLRDTAVPFRQVASVAVQIGDVRLAGADGVTGVAGEGGGFGLEGGKVAFREGEEAVGFVLDVVFEEEVVLLF